MVVLNNKRRKQLKAGWPVSLSYFKDNIYFWEIPKGQKCLRNPKMDIFFVQFLKTQ
jgi:hypothetical protein